MEYKEGKLVSLTAIEVQALNLTRMRAGLPPLMHDELVELHISNKGKQNAGLPTDPHQLLLLGWVNLPEKLELLSDKEVELIKALGAFIDQARNLQASPAVMNETIDHIRHIQDAILANAGRRDMMSRRIW